MEALPTPEIRTELESYIRNRKITAQYFAEQAGINPGTVSAILKKNRPISMKQLDRLTAGMDLPEGALYESYIDECFVDHTPHWRRLRPYLLRCAELNKLACMRQALPQVLENASYIPLIFDMAEELFQAHKHEAATLLYEKVAESEKYQHSESLAICHYRLFRLSILNDTKLWLRAAIRFESFQDKLPDHYRLDGLLQLANVYYTLGYWEKMELYADQLRTLANVICGEMQSSKHRNRNYVLPTERHFVVYYGQGYLIKSAALEHQGRYEEAKTYISHYADLSWFAGLDENGLAEVEKFKRFAQANRYNVELLLGNFAPLYAYTCFLEEHPEEIVPSMVMILKAANKHGYSLDNVLGQFLERIMAMPGRPTYYHEVNYINRYMQFYYQLAIYHFSHGRNREGVNQLLQSLGMGLRQGNKSSMLQCISLYEQFKKFAAPEQDLKYQTLIKEVGKNEESHTLAGVYSLSEQLCCASW